MLAVLVASVMVQTGDAFLRNGRDNIPAKRENALADEFFNEYLRERFPVDERFKKSELNYKFFCYADTRYSQNQVFEYFVRFSGTNRGLLKGWLCR